MRTLTDLLLRKKLPLDSLDKQSMEDYHAHGYLGNLYLSLGSLAEAELEYSRAYALFPSEEVKARLADVRRRRARQWLSVSRTASATRAA